MRLKTFTDWLIPGSRLSFWLHLLVLGQLTLAALHLRAWHEYRIGESLLDKHEYADAIPHFERCLVVWPESIPLKLHLARAERIAGSLQKADDYLAELRTSKQTLPESYRIESLLLMVNQGYVEEAEQPLMQYLRNQHPESPAIYANLVMFHLKMRDPYRAYYLLDQWQKVDPHNPLIYELRGSSLVMQGQTELAINELLHSLELNADSLPARLALCELYFSTSKFVDLAPHVSYLAGKHAGNRQARLIICRYLIEVNRLDEADQQLAALLEEYPEDRSIQFAQASSFYRRNDFQRAVKFLRTAASRDYTDTQVLYMLERCLVALNDPELPACRARLMEVRAQSNRLRELSQKLVHAKREPNQDELLERGQIYLKIGEVSAGFRDLGLVLKRSPNNLQVFQIIADYYTSKDDPLVASQYLRRIEAIKQQQSRKASK